MADGPLLVERADGVALVTLNRPAKHNALSLDLLGRLAAAVRELGEDAAVRVLSSCAATSGASRPAWTSTTSRE